MNDFLTPHSSLFWIVNSLILSMCICEGKQFFSGSCSLISFSLWEKRFLFPSCCWFLGEVLHYILGLGKEKEWRQMSRSYPSKEKREGRHDRRSQPFLNFSVCQNNVTYGLFCYVLKFSESPYSKFILEPKYIYVWPKTSRYYCTFPVPGVHPPPSLWCTLPSPLLPLLHQVAQVMMPKGVRYSKSLSP